MTALARPAIRPQAAPNAATAFAADVLEGLAATPKRLPAKDFYDEAGSRLFQRITELPEDYPTRTERRLLEPSAEDIAGLADPGAARLELRGRSAPQGALLFAPKVYLSPDVAG